MTQLAPSLGEVTCGEEMFSVQVKHKHGPVTLFNPPILIVVMITYFSQFCSHHNSFQMQAESYLQCTRSSYENSKHWNAADDLGKIKIKPVKRLSAPILSD